MPSLPPVLPTGSGAITPWLPDLVMTYIDGGYVEEWVQPSTNFRCVINCRTLSEGTYNDPVLGVVQPMRGKFSGGPSGPIPVSFMLDFEEPIYSSGTFTSIDFADYTDYWIEAKLNVSGGAGYHRSYTWPPARWVRKHPNSSERDKGWSAIVSKMQSILENRPHGHIWAPSTPPKVNVGNFTINQGKTTGDWDAQRQTPEGYNYWDRGHNESGPEFAAAALGHPLGFVLLWQKWKWVIQAFHPNQSLLHLDQARSTMWIILLMLRAKLAGFDWADPNMTADHVGGYWLGLNGGAGLTPGFVFNIYMKKILGNRFKPSGNTENWTQQLGTMVDTNDHCSDSGDLGCLCSGVLTGGNWIGPDGVNYGKQLVSIYSWQAGMMSFGLVRMRQFYDYMLNNYSDTVLEPDVLTGLDALIDWQLEFVKRSGWFEVDAGPFNEQKKGNWAYAYGVGRHSATADFGPSGYPSFAVVDKMATDMQAVCGKYPSINYHRFQRNDGDWILRKGDTGYTSPCLVLAAIALRKGVTVEELTSTFNIKTPDPVLKPDNYLEWQKFLDVVLAVQEGGGSGSVDLFTTEAAGAVTDSASVQANSRTIPVSEILSLVVDSSMSIKNAVVSETLGTLIDSAIRRTQKHRTQALGSVADSKTLDTQRGTSEILAAITDLSSVLVLSGPNFPMVFEALGSVIDVSILRKEALVAESLSAISDSSAVLRSDAPFVVEQLGAVVDSSNVVMSMDSNKQVSEVLNPVGDFYELVEESGINMLVGEVLGTVSDMGSRPGDSRFSQSSDIAHQELQSADFREIL